MDNQERLDQVAAQLEAVARRLRAGEAVGVPGDLSAWWFDSDADRTYHRPDIDSAIRVARRDIGDCRGGDGDPWAEDMQEIGWGITVWVERAQAVDVREAACPRCDGAGDEGLDTGCERCDGDGKDREFSYLCNYELRPIPANAVLRGYKEGPDMIEAEKGPALATMAERLHHGRPGERDPDASCDMYNPDPGAISAPCGGDGHYLCRGCVHYAPGDPVVYGPGPDGGRAAEKETES